MAMKRTQVYLTQNEHKALTALTALSRRTKKKRSEIIREAIDAHLEKNAKKSFAAVLDEVAGSWKDNRVDFDTMRKSWDRKIEILN